MGNHSKVFGRDDTRKVSLNKGKLEYHIGEFCRDAGMK